MTVRVNGKIPYIPLLPLVISLSNHFMCCRDRRNNNYAADHKNRMLYMSHLVDSK